MKIIQQNCYKKIIYFIINNKTQNGKINLNVDLVLSGYIYGRNDYADFSNSTNSILPDSVPIGWVHEFTSKKNNVVYNSKVNYDGCLNLPAGVWLIHTSLTIERNSTIWFTPISPAFSSFIAAYDNPSIGGNMIHSSSETYYYLYNNIPKFIVQMSPILFIVKNCESRVLPNYIFNVTPNVDEMNNSSTIVWKTIYTKIA